MRDGELVPFAPFSRTLFGMLPTVFVTRSECCNDLFLTGTLGARANVCPDQVALSTLPKGPESGPSQVIPGGREQAPEGRVQGIDRPRGAPYKALQALPPPEAAQASERCSHLEELWGVSTTARHEPYARCSPPAQCSPHSRTELLLPSTALLPSAVVLPSKALPPITALQPSMAPLLPT